MTAGNVNSSDRIIDAAAGSKLLLDVREAAALLSMGRTAVFEEIRRGRLKSVKRGRARLIPLRCLHEFVNLLMTETEESDAA